MKTYSVGVLVLLALFFVIVDLCDISFKFAKVCRRVKLNRHCQPPFDIENCGIWKTTYNDRKCPFYNCVRPTTSTSSRASTTRIPTTTTTRTTPTTTTIPTTIQTQKRIEKVDDLSTETTSLPTLLRDVSTLSNHKNLAHKVPTKSVKRTQFFTLDCFLRDPTSVPRCSTKEKEKKNLTLKKKKKKLSRSLKPKPKMINETNTLSTLSGTDCGDKECFLRHSILQNCVLYLQTNVTDCVIPCNLSGCKKETHHFMNCPIWECKFYPNSTTSTTSTTTETSPTTPTTTEPAPFVPNDTFFYSSVACNAIVILLILTIVGWKFYQCLKRRRTVTHVIQTREPLLDSNDHYFTLGNGNDDDSNSNGSTSPLITSEVVAIALNRRNYHDRVLDELELEDVPLNSQNHSPQTPLQNRQSNYLTFKPLPKTPKVENVAEHLAETEL